MGKRGWFFTAPMPAPYYIDMVWRMAVRYDFYEDYCTHLVGGYIDRIDEVTQNSFKSYKKLYEKYFLKSYYEYL